ncbi:MAG: type II toxin-antitoxin system Phd/YefM family antitoxin [Deltaproteobacteria bacterium]|jgi:prevent-host-death family protein|nr:type II toxin-antitoxin system Phd/YefM family antitoxin [Deltaproteobacteria bacterium]MBW1796196.1 type II toxin-antitoxin system Phd/YefM family antitoxin [Deltaproteobacteria bacterium]
MQSISVGELKARFSEVLEQVRKGEEIIISYGKKRKRVAVLMPYDHYTPKQERKLGLLKDRGGCVIHKDFKLTDGEMLSS